MTFHDNYRSEVNKVLLIGTIDIDPYISHYHNNNICYSFNLKVSRNYDNIDVSDYIRIYYSSPKKHIKYDKGDRVMIQGHLVRTKLLNRPTVAVAVDSIESIEDNSVLDTNEIEFSGTVVAISDIRKNSRDKIYQRFIIENNPSATNHRVTLRVMALNKSAVYTSNNLKINDRVIIQGTIESDNLVSVRDSKGNIIHSLLGVMSYLSIENDDSE